MLTKLINPAIEALLQRAVYEELYASHFYRHLSNQCQRTGWFGAAKFFANESSEEQKHYQAIADYLNDRGVVAEIPALPACTIAITGMPVAVKAAYDIEVELGSKYAGWYGKINPVDPVTGQFLLPYLEIQRKSIGEYGDLISRLIIAGEDRGALLLIDQEMGG